VPKVALWKELVSFTQFTACVVDQTQTLMVFHPSFARKSPFLMANAEIQVNEPCETMES
jgi:hypothetical protein